MGVKLTDPTFTRADNARIRAGLDGRVSQRVTYPQWLRRQNAAIQTEVLGPARRKLWQEGRIEVRSFVNRRGRILRLDELPVAERRLRSGQPRG